MQERSPLQVNKSKYSRIRIESEIRVLAKASIVYLRYLYFTLDLARVIANLGHVTRIPPSPPDIDMRLLIISFIHHYHNCLHSSASRTLV